MKQEELTHFSGRNRVKTGLLLAEVMEEVRGSQIASDSPHATQATWAWRGEIRKADEESASGWVKRHAGYLLQ